MISHCYHEDLEYLNLNYDGFDKQMKDKDIDLVVLYEHPEWQKPLFRELRKHNLTFQSLDLKKTSFSDDIFNSIPKAKIYFNQASPSAYTRGNTRAVPLVLALMEYLEAQGAKVLNGSEAFRFELSKMTQIAMMKRYGISYPKTIAFNDISVLKQFEDELKFPMMLKPNQGGSGARMFLIDSLSDLATLLEMDPSIWEPDNLLLLQEFIPHNNDSFGVIRMEFLGNKLLYAVRVVSSGKFNLCPSDYCNPETTSVDKVNFYPYPEVPQDAVNDGLRLLKAGGIDVGSVEYLEADDGRRVFYDINANSNLRGSIGEYFGFNPFTKVVEFLKTQLDSSITPNFPTILN